MRPRRPPETSREALLRYCFHCEGPGGPLSGLMEALLSPTSPQSSEPQERSLLRGAERDRHEGRLRLALAGFLILLATALLCTIVIEEDAEQLLPADLLKNTKVRGGPKTRAFLARHAHMGPCSPLLTFLEPSWHSLRPFTGHDRPTEGWCQRQR